MSTELNGSPKFRLLDIVIAWPEEADELSRKGTVTQVRQYPGNRFKYSVAPFDPDGVATIFWEEDLISTNERSKVETFTVFGRFHVREIVRISSIYKDQQIAGRKGEIISGYGDDDSEFVVWINDLEEVWIVPASDLISTGKRRPPLKRHRANSLKVSQTGQLLGCEEYIVLEDVDDL